MKLNWKVRVKNKGFWLALIPAALLLVQAVGQVFGLTWSWALGEQLLGVVNALFAVLALAAGVCAVTFTGAGNAGASQPLTGEELAWFNEDFFNQGDSPCMPNQFLTCLYDSPEEIDLFQLFYNGTGEPEAMDETDPGRRESLIAEIMERIDG